MLRFAVLACSIALNGAYESDPTDITKYLAEREALLKGQEGLRFDATTRGALNAQEQAANATLVALRDALRVNISRFTATPLRAVKDLVEPTQLFSLLHTMPKGVTLHIHLPAMNSIPWLISNVTSRPHCYFYWNTSYGDSPSAADTPKGTVTFLPENSTIPAGYLSLAALLKANPGKSAEQILLPYWDVLHNETFIDETHDPWGPFQRYFTIVGGALSYRPVLEDYVREAFLTAALKWKVNFVELRALGLGSNAYYLSGSDIVQMSMQDTLALYTTVAAEVTSLTGGSFVGFNMIYSQYRQISNTVLRQALEEAVALQTEFPEIVVGFDLVGQEDKGEPLRAFLPELLEFQDKLDYYFHAGETDWSGRLTTGQNIVDAVLLKTKRIGHGLAMAKLPLAIEAALRDGVAVEVCPTSNQGLQYVLDARDHPISSLLAEGVPFVLSNDDPALLTTTQTMAYDFILAFLSWDIDLASLKQLALNSITHSSSSLETKQKIHALWEPAWNEWVASVLRM